MATPSATPQVITRAQWGADESIRCSDPTYDDTLKETVVHHTAGTNDYTREQSAEIVRGIAIQQQQPAIADAAAARRDYLDETGVMVTGDRVIDGVVYFFDSSGRMR